MVKVIFAIAGGVAFTAVMLAIFAAIAMFSHKKPGVPGSWYFWNGHAFLTGRNFEPAAEPARRLFMLCMGVFFLAVLIGITFGLIGWPDPNAVPPAA